MLLSFISFIILIDLWYSINDFKCNVGGDLGLCDLSKTWSYSRQSKHAENNTEKDSDGVTSSELSASGMVVESLVNPDTSHKEGISITAVDNAQEESSGDSKDDT